MPPVSLPATAGPGPANLAPIASAAPLPPNAAAALTAIAIVSIRTMAKPRSKSNSEEMIRPGRDIRYPLFARSQHRIGTRHHADRPPVGGIKEHDAAKADIAADPCHPRIGDDVEVDRTEKMRGLVNGCHTPIAVPGGRTGQHHRGIRQRHERLSANDRAVAAELAGIG